MTSKTLFIFLVVLLVGAIGFSFYSANSVIKSNQEKEVLVTLMKSDIEFAELSTLSTDVEEYYALASEDYDYNDFDGVVKNCEKSRDKASNYIQGIRELQAKLDDRQEKVIVLYSQRLDAIIDVYTNLYEACEYFESSARQYSIEDYIGGGDSIEMMNKKIEAHDLAVDRYGILTAKYSNELDNFLGLDN